MTVRHTADAIVVVAGMDRLKDEPLLDASAERLAAQRRLGFLVDEDDAPAGVGQLGRGDEAGEPRADDDRVGRVLRGHRAGPTRSTGGGFQAPLSALVRGQ